MFDGTSFGKMMNISNSLLDTYAVRHEVIADNIANVGTPNFKRMDVSFEAELSRSLNSTKGEGFRAKVTDERHIPFVIEKDYREVDPRISVEYDTSYRNDGNNVDIDREMAEQAKNAMRYNMYSQLVGNKFRQMRRVIGVS